MPGRDQRVVDLRGDRCPSVGSSDDRPRGIPVAVRGEIQWPPMGTFSWPPSPSQLPSLKHDTPNKRPPWALWLAPTDQELPFQFATRGLFDAVPTAQQLLPLT